MSELAPAAPAGFGVRGLTRWWHRLAAVLIVTPVMFGVVAVAAPPQPAEALCPGSLCRPEGALLLAEYATQAGGTAALSSVGTGASNTPTRTLGTSTPGVKVKPKAGGRWGLLGGLISGVMSLGGLFDTSVEVDETFDAPPELPGVSGWTYVPDPGGSYPQPTFTVSTLELTWDPFTSNPAAGDRVVVEAIANPEHSINYGRVGLTARAVTATGSYQQCEGAVNSGPTGQHYSNFDSGYDHVIMTITFPEGDPCVAPFPDRRVNLTVSTSSRSSGTQYGSFRFTEPPRPSAPESGTVTTTVWCRAADGSELEVTQTLTGVALVPGEEVPLPDAECPTGSVATKTRADWTGSETGATRELVPETAAPGWVQEIPTEYPACMDGSCLLVLERVLTDGTKAECLSDGTWNPVCTGWATEPDRDTLYQCRWGGYSVPLDKCAPYKNEPVPGTRTPTADPAGDPLPDPLATPEEEEAAAQEPRNCEGPPTFLDTLSPSWHWNNMKCLFIPDLEYMPETQALVETAVSKPPISWVTGISNLWPAEGALPVGGGICPDWRIKLPMVDYDENIICDSTYTWAIVGGRTFILGFMVVTAFAPLVRSIWYSILPFVRPVPTGGIHGG